MYDICVNSSKIYPIYSINYPQTVHKLFTGLSTSIILYKQFFHSFIHIFLILSNKLLHRHPHEGFTSYIIFYSSVLCSNFNSKRLFISNVINHKNRKIFFWFKFDPFLLILILNELRTFMYIVRYNTVRFAFAMAYSLHSLVCCPAFDRLESPAPAASIAGAGNGVSTAPAKGFVCCVWSFPSHFLNLPNVLNRI